MAFLVYFSLLRTWSVTSLSFISVFTPAIALLLGFVFLDERPTPGPPSARCSSSPASRSPSRPAVGVRPEPLLEGPPQNSDDSKERT